MQYSQIIADEPLEIAIAIFHSNAKVTNEGDSANFAHF